MYGTRVAVDDSNDDVDDGSVCDAVELGSVWETVGAVVRPCYTAERLLC